MMAEDPKTQEKAEITAGGELHYPDEWLDTEQAAEFAHQAPATLKNWRSLGEGPPFIRGRPTLYSKKDLQAWMVKRRKESGA